jgi:DNA repair exonuclease SbcCD ATPase subunit
METPLGPSQRQNLPNTINASQNENSNDFATSIRKELNSQRQKSASVALRWRDQLEELVRSLQAALADKSNRVRKLQQERNKITATMGQMENKVKSQTSHIAHLEVELRDTLESKETESANLRDRLGRAERAAEMAGQVGGRYAVLLKYYVLKAFARICRSGRVQQIVDRSDERIYSSSSHRADYLCTRFLFCFIYFDCFVYHVFCPLSRSSLDDTTAVLCNYAQCLYNT